MKVAVFFLFAFLGISLNSSLAEMPAVKLCSEDDDSYPWFLKERPGLTDSLLLMVEKKYGGKIERVRLPWKRCLEETKQGTMNGALKISYSAERAAELGVYPMKGDKHDDSKRLLIDTYSLYRLKGSSVSWDGKVLKAEGTVGVQTGFSVGKQLKELGAKIDDGTRSATINLQKLLDGRLVAVALQTEEGDASLAEKPEFKDKLEKVTPVLVEKPYYLMVSKQFYASNKDAAEALWNAIESARESSEYKEIVKKFK